MNDLQMYQIWVKKSKPKKKNVKKMMYKLFKFTRILTSFSNVMNKFCNPSL
jgi:hypothetical protein